MAAVLSNRYSLVVGLGATGLAAVRYLAARGGAVLAIDSRERPPALEELDETLPNVRVELATLDPRWLDGAERVLLSPGLTPDIPLVREALARGVPVLSEIELFAEAAAAPAIAVTGSNGKSTVVCLAADILAAQGLVAPRGGNLGPPALELLDVPDADVYVVEISSFQMEFTRSFEPEIAAVLNVSPDHIDRHGSLERYAALKGALLAAAEHAVYSWDDPLVRKMGQAHPAATPFSVREPLESGWSVVEKNGERWLARDARPMIPSRELALAGSLGEANSLAALALTESRWRDAGAALEVLRQFAGLPHRCERVAERRGIRYVDDSKGTNVGATVAALGATTGAVVLIAGGLAKGQDFSPLAAAARGRVRAAVLLGEAAPALEATLAPVCETVRAGDMGDAVLRASALAQSGDTVLLSPACASQDMFRDYRERGETFQRAVRGLAA